MSHTHTNTHHAQAHESAHIRTTSEGITVCVKNEPTLK